MPSSASKGPTITVDSICEAVGLLTMSTFQYTRSGSEIESAAPQTPLDRCDIIAFLGVAQSRGIDLLPITWEPTLDCLGQGETTEIREASFGQQTSFAFKRRRFKNAYDLMVLETQLLPSLAAEVAVLGHPSIWDCPSIAKLEGICWDVYPPDGHVLSREETIKSEKGGIMPVLVFEKAKHGDLYHFMTHGPGQQLGLNDKLWLCTEAASAVAIMHINSKHRHQHHTETAVDTILSGIIHGDIKPQNILVFNKGLVEHQPKAKMLEIGTRYADSTDVLDTPKSEPWYAPDDTIDGDTNPQNSPVLDDTSPKYTAKVTDFGYSTQYTSVTDLIIMPRSEPWYAPEWHHRGFTPAQATRMDSYSFGMVVLWLLSYSTEDDSVRKFQNDLNLSSNDALSLAYRRIGHVECPQRLKLQLFFEKTLTNNASDRCSNFLHLRDILGSELYTANRFCCEWG